MLNKVLILFLTQALPKLSVFYLENYETWVLTDLSTVLEFIATNKQEQILF